MVLARVCSGCLWRGAAPAAAVRGAGERHQQYDGVGEMGRLRRPGHLRTYLAVLACFKRARPAACRTKFRDDQTPLATASGTPVTAVVRGLDVQDEELERHLEGVAK